YLRDFVSTGVTLPPTHWFEPGDRPDCDALLREWGVDRGVLKPRVSATAYGTHLLSAGQRLDESEWMQLDAVGGLFHAFVPEIETQGEGSLICLDGAFSHAVRKRPEPGDFRVQSDFGGTWEPLAPAPALSQFGELVLAASAHLWIYARVDIVETQRGPILMELELIEPQLFLTVAAAVRLADALIARVANGAPARS